MEIRPYTIDDKVALLALLRGNTPHFFDPSEEEDFHFYLDNQIEDYFVVIQNFEIVGCGGINYFPDQRIARLSWDIISASSHGKGLGNLLVKHRIQLLKSNPSYERIVVRTSQHAYKFYEKMGFNLTKITVNFWAENLDLYEMDQLISISR